MASQRKARLSDIRAPAGSRPIESRGFVRLPRERIRQSGFQPSRELFNFRALSRTLEQAGRVGAQLHADIQNEEQAEEFEKLNTAVKDAHEVEEDLTSEGGEIRFLNEFPMPGREGEEIVIRPGLGHAPDTISPHLREVSKEIGEATRAGILSSDVSPTLGRATGKNLGRAAAQVYLETLLHDDIGPLSRGNWENGKFVPEVDRDLRFRERYTQLLEANPALSVNSDNPDMSAILEFQRQVKDYKRQISLKVKAARSDQARKMAADSAVMSIQATMSSALDMTTGLDGVPNFAEIQDGEDAAAVDSISETLSGMHAAGLTGDEVDSVFIQAVMGKARAIDAEYADRPYEAEMQLSHLASMVENVPMGGTGVAADHPKFAETALAIDAMINKRVRGAGGGTGARSRFTAQIGESPFLEKAFEALEGEDAVSLEKAKDDHMEWARQQVDIKGLIGSDRLSFLQDAREVWKNQAKAFGYDTTRDAQSDFALQSVMAVAQNGDPEGARERLNTLYAEGIIKPAEHHHGIEAIGKVTTVHKKLMRDPQFATAIENLDHLADRLGKMGLAESDVGPILEAYRGNKVMLLSAANDIFIDAEDGPAAIRESMERGILSSDFELASKGLRTRIEDFESTMSELDKRLAEGHTVSAEDQKRFVARGGSKARSKIAAIKQVTTDGYVWQQDSGTRGSWEDLNSKLKERVRGYVESKIGEIGGEVTDVGDFARTLERKAERAFRALARVDNQKQFGKADPNWRDSLVTKWEQSLDTTISQMADLDKSLRLDSARGRQASVAEDSLKTRQRSLLGDSKKDFELKMRSRLSGSESDIPKSLREVIDNQQYAGFITNNLYGGLKGTTPVGWLGSVETSIRKIEARPSTSREGKQQDVFDMLLFAGAIRVDDLAKTTFWGNVFNEMPEGDSVTKTERTIRDNASDHLIETKNLKVNAYIGPMFKTVEDLEDFTSDGDRFAKVSEKLGFGKFDPTKNPDDLPEVQKWKVLQAMLIKERIPR